MMPSGSEPLTESGLPTRSQPKQKRSRSVVDVTSPMAADGGFGQMGSDESEDEVDPTPMPREQDEERIEYSENDQGLGDDFDDFEAGTIDEDFGDFDDGDAPELEPEPEPEPVEPAVPSLPSLPPIESHLVSQVAMTCPHENLSRCQLAS